MITRDEWLKAYAEAIEPPANDSESLTSRELAALWGISQRRSRERLNVMVAKGKATVTKKWIKTADGVSILVTAYKLANK